MDVLANVANKKQCAALIQYDLVPFEKGPGRLRVRHVPSQEGPQYSRTKFEVVQKLSSSIPANVKIKDFIEL